MISHSFPFDVWPVTSSKWVTRLCHLLFVFLPLKRYFFSDTKCLLPLFLLVLWRSHILLGSPIVLSEFLYSFLSFCISRQDMPVCSQVIIQCVWALFYPISAIHIMLRKKIIDMSICFNRKIKSWDHLPANCNVHDHLVNWGPEQVHWTVSKQN